MNIQTKNNENGSTASLEGFGGKIFEDIEDIEATMATRMQCNISIKATVKIFFF